MPTYSDADLRRLVIEHLGIKPADPVNVYIPRIAEQVLPAGWTPVR